MKLIKKIRPYLYLFPVLFGFFLYLNGTVIKKLPGVDLFTPGYYSGHSFSNAPVLEINWNRVLLGISDDSNATQRLRLRLAQMDRERSWGRIGLAAQGSYYEELSQVTDRSLAQVSQMLGKTQGRRASEIGNQTIEQNEEFAGLKTPGAMVAGIAAIYTGKMVRYRVSDEVRFGSSTQIDNNQFQGQQLHLLTPWITAMLAYTDVGSGPQGAYGGKDTLTASVSKEFSTIGVRANAVYGNETKATTYSISKTLSPEVSVSYDESAHPAGGARSRSVGVGYSHGF